MPSYFTKGCPELQLRKDAIFEACVMSKLLYNLHSLCMNEAEKRKVDAFQVRCLRRTLKIPPSFYSRVSNQTVLEQAQCKTASMILLERQMTWMGKLAACPGNHILKHAVFENGTQIYKPRTPQGLRKRGRPKTCWATYVFQHDVQAAGGEEALQTMWQDTPSARAAWARCVKRYCHC